jgi:hypothetical protein
MADKVTELNMSAATLDLTKSGFSSAEEAMMLEAISVASRNALNTRSTTGSGAVLEPDIVREGSRLSANGKDDSLPRLDFEPEKTELSS